MKCKFKPLQLSFYVDGECSPKQTRRIEAHLKICKRCQGEVADLRRSTNIISQLSKVRISKGYELEFQRRLEEETAGEKRPVFRVGKDILQELRGILEGFREALYPVPALAKVSVTLIILVGLILISINLQRVSLPLVVSAKGMVKIYQAKDGEWLAAKSNMRLRKADIIRTGKDSYIDIQRHKTYKLRFKQNSEVVMVKLPPRYRRGATAFKVNKGVVLVKTQEKFKGRQLRIQTPVATAVAHGTGFLVEVAQETGRMWLGVLDGQVAVTSHYRVSPEGKESTVIVKAREKTVVSSNRLPTHPEPLTDIEWGRLQEIEQIGRLLVSLVLSDSPARVRELLGPTRLYAYGREPIQVQRLVSEAILLLDQANRQKDRRKHLQSIRKLEEVIAKYPHPRYNPQFLLFIGAYYEYLSLHEEAIDSFGKVVSEYRNSKWASLAQCAIGIIQEEGLNDYAKARESYQKVISYYPASLEVTEAEDGLRRLAAK